MGLTRVLLVSSVIFAALAYVYYEPLPAEITYKLAPRVVLIVSKTCYHLTTFLSYLGYSKGQTYRDMLEFVSSVAPDEEPSVTTEEVMMNEVPVVVFKPEGLEDDSRAVIYFHGGGWVFGGKHTYRNVMKTITKDLNAVVFFPLYRLAPEHVYPAAIDDCEQTTKYILQHAADLGIDKTRVAVMGDSAGGNLATAVSIRLRDRKSPTMPRLQVLLYPVLQIIDFDTPSYRANKNGPFLTTEFVSLLTTSYLFGNDYFKYSTSFERNNHTNLKDRKSLSSRYLDLKTLPDDDFLRDYVKVDHDNQELWNEIKEKATDASLSPLLAKDLTGLPPAYVSTCQYDALRDDGYFYVKRLRDAGVEVSHDNLYQCFHAWIQAAVGSLAPDVLKKEFKLIMDNMNKRL